jgi:hypothetical protein
LKSFGYAQDEFIPLAGVKAAEKPYFAMFKPS